MNVKNRQNNSNNDPRRRPLKIAILGSLPPLRALSSYCLELSLALSELGKIEFISFKKIYPTFLYPGWDLRDDHSFPKVRHSNLKVWRRLTWYNPISWIVEGLFKDADLLHVQWWSAPLIFVYIVICLAFKLRKKPIVCTIHNVQQHERSDFSNFLSMRLFSLCDHFIVHSEGNKKQLKRYNKVDTNKVTVIPHGPLGFQVKEGLDRERVRKEMGFDVSNKVVLLFGTIRRYKGIETSLRAFSKVLHEIPEARLLIAGKLWEDWGPYNTLIRDLNISFHVKTILKYIPSNEIAVIFMASDLIILPYHHFDAQSGVGATAIAFRKPMIVSNTGGLPELVIDQRNIVPPNDVNALAQEIISCLQDDSRLKQMSEDAEEVAKLISWSAVAEKTWLVYRNLLCLM